MQYLGLDYQDPINLETITKRSVIPCQFRLIKDNLNWIFDAYFKKISPVSESSPTIYPSSDETSQSPDSRNHHPQAVFLLQ